jgi:sulfur carrier protein ThiS
MMTHANLSIDVELYASLMSYLPAGSSRHRTMVTVPADITPHQLIDRLGIPRELAHLVLRNGVFLLPLERNEAVFEDGDLFALWPPVAGG